MQIYPRILKSYLLLKTMNNTRFILNAFNHYGINEDMHLNFTQNYESDNKKCNSTRG